MAKQSPVSAYESEAKPGTANVYEQGALVAVLVAEGSGWVPRWLNQGKDDAGKTVWAAAESGKALALTQAADEAYRLMHPEIEREEKEVA